MADFPLEQFLETVVISNLPQLFPHVTSSTSFRFYLSPSLDEELNLATPTGLL